MTFSNESFAYDITRHQNDEFLWTYIYATCQRHFAIIAKKKKLVQSKWYFVV